MKRRDFLKTVGLSGLGVWGACVWPSIPEAHAQRTRLSVFLDERLGKINRNIYGQFTEHLGGCVYDAMWVSPDSRVPNINGLRKDTIQALKDIRTPIIRWPGGCFADLYHWCDGVGPREKRPKRWNWGGVGESNAFGTDEFLEYCRLCGAQPYLCLNVGSGTVKEAAEWMEYCNGKLPTEITESRAVNAHAEPYSVRYWAVGNEVYGCGGKFDAEDYARQYAHYVNFLSPLGQDDPVEFIACGNTQGEWNQKFLEALLKLPYGKIGDVQGLSIHHYFQRGPGVNFTDADYYDLLADVSTLESYIQKTISLIDHYTQGGPHIGIVLDEWGMWHADTGTGAMVLRQSNTLRDAVLAAVVLNSLNQFGTAVSMANIAQTFNVLQSMAFTRGPEFVLTPTYYTFDLYQPHMDAMGLKVEIDGPTFKSEAQGMEVTRNYLSASASLKESEQKLCLTLVNQHLTDPLEVEIELHGTGSGGMRGALLRELTSPSVHDENTVDKPTVISRPVEKRVSVKMAKFVLVIPAHSVQALRLEL
jgi:alpha-N-arabinofuranosidase